MAEDRKDSWIRRRADSLPMPVRPFPSEKQRYGQSVSGADALPVTPRPGLEGQPSTSHVQLVRLPDTQRAAAACTLLAEIPAVDSLLSTYLTKQAYGEGDSDPGHQHQRPIKRRTDNDLQDPDSERRTMDVLADDSERRTMDVSVDDSERRVTDISAGESERRGMGISADDLDISVGSQKGFR